MGNLAAKRVEEKKEKNWSGREIMGCIFGLPIAVLVIATIVKIASSPKVDLSDQPLYVQIGVIIIVLSVLSKGCM
ncbi:MAG: hypothetical protein PHG22_02105 [Patescibacteria group bacterium]|nr:hypothetical protein [Patescibacteria group bacterium]